MPSGLSVVIDGRPLVGQRTGIGVHTAEIAARLGTNPPPVIASHASILDRTSIEHCRFDVDPMRLGVAWQQLRLPRVASIHSADVVWGPHGTLPVKLKVPAVVSVHDLTSITMPHKHRVKTVISFNLFIRASLEMARHIAAVSRISADEIVRGFGIAASKISIVPNGVDEFFCPGRDPQLDERLRSLLRFDPSERFILYVGTLEPRKGIGDLLEALDSMPSPPRLVLAGARGWGRRHDASARASRVSFAGFVERDVLRELYRRASLLVYPSRYEGFGLPPLEAMACGTPVIAAASGAIPEVVGDAARLFRPGDAEELAEAIGDVLSSQALSQDLTGRGRDRIRRFTWDESARLMGEILSEAARG